MSNTFKRRIFRFSVLSLTCFLLGILLDDLNMVDSQDANITFYSYFFLFAGVLLAFKALDTWSAWDEDKSVDIEIAKKNYYPLVFYTEASILVIISLSIFAIAYARNTLSVDEASMAIFSLLIAGIGWCIGRVSTGIQ
jgi:hypothetical protein